MEVEGDVNDLIPALLKLHQLNKSGDLCLHPSSSSETWDEFDEAMKVVTEWLQVNVTPDMVREVAKTPQTTCTLKSYTNTEHS